MLGNVVVDACIRMLGIVRLKNKQTAQGGGRYAQILMSREWFKELINAIGTIAYFREPASSSPALKPVPLFSKYMLYSVHTSARVLATTLIHKAS